MRTFAPTRSQLRLPLPASSLFVPVLAAIGGAAFLAWKPGVARSMASSPRAAGFTVVVAILVLGAGWLLPRMGRGPRTTVAIQLVPVLAAFLVTVAPAFRQVTVNEAFPTAVDNPQPTAEASPAIPGAVQPGLATVLGRGHLAGIDHRASGEVLLLRREDGSRVVRVERLDVEPGPDYQVYVVPGADQHKPSDGVHLDQLRGNRGNQNYDVPADFRPTTPVTGLIWCRAFAVPVANATIR
jgi:hypothetical protein